MKRRWDLGARRRPGKTVLEYLPDADEIERSPVPRIAQFTVHALVTALIAAARKK